MDDTSDNKRSIAFSTALFHEHEAKAAWREVFGRTLLQIDVTPLGERFQAEAKVTGWNGFGMIDASITGAFQRNSPELIANDHLTFGSVVSMTNPHGTWNASQLGRNPELLPGDGVLLSNSDVGSVLLPTECSFFTFAVPRHAVTTLVPDAEAQIGRSVSSARPEMRLLTNYLQIARDETLLGTPELRNAFATHVIDLLALCIGPRTDALELVKSRGFSAARVEAIKQDIQRTLNRADFSVHFIAKRHSVTPRYIQMLFERSGPTFSQYVLEQRLSAVHAALSNARSETPISEIAYAAGFADLSNFNRAFRQRFGCTPSDVRANARK